MASYASATATICAPRGMASPCEPVRVPLAVPTLVVAADQVHVLPHERDGLQNFDALHGMLLDDPELGLR